ncbi:hypothetical protein ACFWN1_14980 [Streptomyces sp. NPDC058459]|uniref:hypothetical protein n=1 Tax=Streptomyces sp. NPDC058459 TaxID=3346508 RepID=UPI003653032D
MSVPIRPDEKPEREYGGRLRKLSFEPGTLAVHQKPRFTIEELKAALFSATYSNPKTVTVKLPQGGTVQVAITRAEPRYEVDKTGEHPSDSPVIFHEYPDWYLEGWVVDGTATPSAQGLRVRMIAYSCGESPELDDMYAQVIPTYECSEGDVFAVSVSDD